MKILLFPFCFYYQFHGKKIKYLRVNRKKERKEEKMAWKRKKKIKEILVFPDLGGD